MFLVALVDGASDLIVALDLSFHASSELVAPDVKAGITGLGAFGLAIVVVGGVDASSKIFIAFVISAIDFVVAVEGFIRRALSSSFVANINSAEDSVVAVLRKMDASASFVEVLALFEVGVVRLIARVDSARLAVVAVIVLRDVEALLNSTGLNGDVVVSASPSVVADDNSVVVGFDENGGDGRSNLSSCTDCNSEGPVHHDDGIVLNVGVNDSLRGSIVDEMRIEGDLGVGHVRNELNLRREGGVIEVRVLISNDGSVGFIESGR